MRLAFQDVHVYWQCAIAHDKQTSLQYRPNQLATIGRTLASLRPDCIQHSQTN